MTWVARHRRVPRVSEPVLTWLCDRWLERLPVGPQEEWSRRDRIEVAAWGLLLDAAAKWPWQEHLALPKGVDARAPWRGF